MVRIMLLWMGGINHLNYYGQAMAMKLPHCIQTDHTGNIRTEGDEEQWNLCGSLCTVSDVIVKLFPLKKPQISDMLIFERVGAYSRDRGNLFIPEQTDAKNLFLA